MRILFLIDGLNCGGKERQLVELACGLKSLGKLRADDLVVVTMVPAGHFDAVLEEEGITVLRVIRRFQFDPFIPFRLKKIFDEFKPDIIHNFSLMTTLYSIFTPKPKGTKIIDGSIRDAFPAKGLKEKIFRTITNRFSDLILANSKAGLDAKRVPKKKSLVLYNGFDFKRIENLRPTLELRKELGIGPGPVVGMVAGFSKFKDWETYFEAAKLVRQKRSAVTFLAVGDGPALKRYKSIFQRMPGIIFTGKRNDVENLVQLCDVGVLCSNPKTHREGIPNTVMEYMALGKPVVVTDGGGIRELVLDDQTGYIVPNLNPSVIADKIQMLLDNPKMTQKMGMTGRLRISEMFSIEYAIDNLWAIYQRLTVKKHG